ncbi:NUDIX domain-containing protein [Streptomyces viridochromogenes]|uniref:NUDIX domain-containing protein n=1 Tax=Streptomyces viridochromogenes TaxID=1938 RepID=UPI0007C7B1F7|nr:NUDIX hydrolase [Streptomyces viridochromogenes]
MTTPTVATTTAALLVNDDRHYLLHLRDANKNIACAGQWSLPGGHPEPGESLDDTISRELLEEADLRVPGLTPLVVIEDTDADDRPTSRVQVYVGTWNGDPAQLPLTEGIMLRWTDPEQIPYLTMDPGTTAVIRHHQQLERGPGHGQGQGQGRQGPHARARGDGHLPVLRMRSASTSTSTSTSTKTVPNVIGVHLYLERDGEILLGLRHPDSAYAPLEHHFLAGHCERESAVDCLVREAWEEAGLVIKGEDVDLVHVVHLVDAPGAPPRLQLVFRARRWQGEPELREPDKCVSWGWWPVDALPEPTVRYTRAALDGIRHGRLYTELGWSTRLAHGAAVGTAPAGVDAAADVRGPADPCHAPEGEV